MTTETMPLTVPLEPTTPIKPSEAIRLGCLIAPVQEFTGGFGHGDTACAIGAMALGLGLERDAFVMPRGPEWDGGRMWGVLVGLRDRPCPADPECLSGGYIPHINDQHFWPRERIADWLAEQGL